MVRQRSHLADELLLDLPTDRELVRQRRPARELHRREPRADLERRQGVPAGGDRDLPGHVGLHRTGGDARQQLRGVGFGETGEPQLAHTAIRQVLAVGIAHRDDEPDAVREQTPGDEGEHVRRFAVEPLRIVDDAQQGLPRRHRRQQRQGPQADQQSVHARGLFESEGDAQRVALTGRERLELVLERVHELMQTGVAELHLGFDPDQAQHTQIGGRGDRGVEQRGLADPRLTTYHQRSAEPAADRVQEEIHVRLFSGTPEQLSVCHPVHRPTIRQTARTGRGRSAARHAESRSPPLRSFDCAARVEPREQSFG